MPATYCNHVCNDVKTVSGEIKYPRREVNELVKQRKELKIQNERLSDKCETIECYEHLHNLDIKRVPIENALLTVIWKIRGSADD